MLIPISGVTGNREWDLDSIFMLLYVMCFVVGERAKGSVTFTNFVYEHLIAGNTEKEVLIK